MSYVSLHNHTDNSIGFDGFQTVKEMVARAKELGYPAIGQTEHGSLRGTIEFYEECKQQGIKPVLGIEFYFTPDCSIKDRKMTFHLCAYAMDQTGYYNMKLLDSYAYKEGNFYYKPRIDWHYIEKFNKGLIFSSACLQSIIRSDDGERWFKKFHDLLGDRFYAEVQCNEMDEQREYNQKVIALAQKYHTKVIVTTDAHYSIKEHAYYHKLWIGITGKSYHDTENYLFSEEEVRNSPMMKGLPVDEYIANTQEIADRCDVVIEMDGNNMAEYPTNDPERDVREICSRRWAELVPQDNEFAYRERFEEEIKVLREQNYLTYLLMVWDMLNYCKQADILSGWGRGSVGGCLVAYLMGIHKVDPIKHGTLFFRFVNPYRRSMADVDTDVDSRYRGKVIDYLKKKYGYVTKIMTLNRLGDPDKGGIGKAALKRAGQALGFEPSTMNNIAGAIDESLDEVLTIDSPLTQEQRETLLDVAKHFYGRIEKVGIHASGIMIFKRNPIEFSPVEGCNSHDSSTGKAEYIRAAAYSNHAMEELFHCLKLDVLGLQTCSCLKMTVDEIKRNTGKVIDLEQIPLNDPDTLKMYANGDLNGVFQMDGHGMQELARQVNVSSMEDIFALIALYRPGCLLSGMTEQYVQGKNGEEVQYPCDTYKEVLKSTYGVLVYQEQTMILSQKMAGYNMGQADALRKIIGRKEKTKIDKAVAELHTAIVNHGYSEDIAQFVCMQVKNAGSYQFNYSHSVEYGIMSYLTAYLKCHYPAYLMVAMLNLKKNNKEKTHGYIKELHKLGITIVPPSFKDGNADWVVLDDKTVQIGLSAVKGIGANVNRDVRLDSFASIVHGNNKRVLFSLIKSGALDYLGIDRGLMMANVEPMIKANKRIEQCEERIKKYTEQGNATMVGKWKDKLQEAKSLSIQRPTSKFDYAQGEVETLGWTEKPLPKIKEGHISKIYTKNDKNGNEMAWLTLGTDYGQIRATVFASGWKEVRAAAVVGESCKFEVTEQGILKEICIKGKVYKTNKRRRA